MNIQKIILSTLLILGALAAIIKITNRDTTDSQSSKLSPKEEVVIKGSDTEVQLVSNLAERFAVSNPNVAISVTGGGSSVGIAAVLNGEVPVANSSRPLKAEEIQQFKDKNIAYQAVVIARDGLSLIVNPVNPLTQLSLEEVGQIYRGEVDDWSQISSFSGEISLYGRQSTSGTYGFFRDVAVKADYAPAMKNMEGNQAILDGVLNDKQGIGYVGVGYIMNSDGTPRADIKILSLTTQANAEAISPLDETAVREGRYPLFRPIYQFISHTPETGSALKDFLQFEVSPAGQELVKQAGFYQITPVDEATNAWLK